MVSVRHMLHAARYVLPLARCRLHLVRCIFFVASCPLHAARCMLRLVVGLHPYRARCCVACSHAHPASMLAAADSRAGRPRPDLQYRPPAGARRSAGATSPRATDNIQVACNGRVAQATGKAQLATRDMPRATCNIQGATDDLQHNMQLTRDDWRQATFTRGHTTDH